ncbi:MAG: exonuclease domain-containing protein [Wujia sp.]
MNYIIFDLEWNQSSRDFENPRMPFEIIEIGAVKLDKKFNIIDRYSSIVKPKLYKKLQPHIKSILNYDEATLRKGRPFDMVFREFSKWCGDDYVFGTWGSMDLSILQTNMDYYYMKPFSTPLMFYNVQQIYADLICKNDKMEKLKHAVNELNIPIEEDKPFHCAVNDAYYTALVLKKMAPKDLNDRYCYDVYNNPKQKEDEIVSHHKHFLEHISKEYDTKVEAMADKGLTSAICYRCGKKLSPKVNWFANTPNSYTCIGKCWYHGLVSGKIRFKQSRDNKIFVIKTMVPTDKKGLEAMKKRQDELRIRRQTKRHNKNTNDQLEDFIEFE